MTAPRYDPATGRVVYPGGDDGGLEFALAPGAYLLAPSALPHPVAFVVHVVPRSDGAFAIHEEAGTGHASPADGAAYRDAEGHVCWRTRGATFRRCLLCRRGHCVQRVSVVAAGRIVVVHDARNYLD